MNPNRLLSFLFLTSLFLTTQAQTKVFKEVGQDVSTEIKAITQDNALVGYLAFTRLEKTDIDSFNYRLTIMDENLNDIGAVNFRQRNLDLQAVSFENDVLCLGYVESAVAGVLTGREARQAYRHASQVDEILLQFISLSGKIIGKYSSPVSLTTVPVMASHSFVMKFQQATFLKNGMQIKNIPGVGFSVFYGDADKRELLLLDTNAKLLRKKKIVADDQFFILQTSGSNIYLLSKMGVDEPEGGYRVYFYSANDSAKEYFVDLKDRQSNWFKVLSFDNDPATGKTFVAGCIINPDREKNFVTARDYSKDPYLGIFSVTLGSTKQDFKPVYSYWNNSGIPGVNEDGLFTDNEFYAKYVTVFKDFSGNTVFVGSALSEKKLLGAAKYRFDDAVFVTQDNKGKLKLDGHVPCDEGKYFGPAGQLDQFDHKSFYKVVNQDTHTNFVIIDDLENTYIYNANAKKVLRTIQHKDGRVNTHIYPAKEGHILVSEYNSKEKQTRFSIEAL